MYNRLDLMELKALYENMIAPILSIILFIVKFLMYIIGIIYISKIEPVYISEASTDYFLKYYYYVIIVIFIGLGYLLSKYFFNDLYSNLSLPSATKGFYYLLGLFLEELRENSCDALLYFIGLSRSRLLMFNFVKFLVKVLFPLLNLVVFVCFVSGFLSSWYLIQLVPLSFVVWLFCLCLYCYETNCGESFEYLKTLIDVEPIDPVFSPNSSNTTIAGIKVSISEEGGKRGFLDEQAPALGQRWLFYGSFYTYNLMYDAYLGYTTKALAVFRVSVWFFIVMVI